MNVPINEETLLMVAFGSSAAGLASSVQYRIQRADLSLLVDWTNAGVVEAGNGVYVAPFTFTVVGAYMLNGRELTLGIATTVPEVYQVTDPGTAADIGTTLAQIKQSTDRLPRIWAEEL